MVELLTPTWLWGLSALMVPIAIHLWSRGSSPRIKLGTLRFIEPSASRRARRVWLTDVGLLAIRCLAIALLTLALAEPVRWREPTVSTEVAGWLLVDPDLVRAGQAPRELTEVLDRRRAEGWQAAVLAPGLPALSRTPFETETAFDSAPDIWSLLREVVWEQAPGTPIEVVSSDRTSSFRGQRPRFAADIAWRTVSADHESEADRWIESAVVDEQGGSARAVIGQSEPGGTSFLQAILELRRSEDSGKTKLSWPEDARDTFELSAGAASVRVGLFASDERIDELGYLVAAVRTLARELPFLVESTYGGQAESRVDSTYELVFWLGGASGAVAGGRLPNGASVSEGGIVVRDAGSRWEGCSGTVRAASGGTFETSRCGEDGSSESGDGGELVWSVLNGRRLLSIHHSDGRRVINFASRFRPDWTSLVHSPVLLDWLSELMGEVVPRAATFSSATAWSDRARLPSGFARPGNASRPVARKLVADRRIENALWLALLVTLGWERWVVSKRAQESRL